MTSAALREGRVGTQSPFVGGGPKCQIIAIEVMGCNSKMPVELIVAG